MDSSETLDSDDSQINLLILGSGGFAQAMENEIRVCNLCRENHSIIIIFNFIRLSNYSETNQIINVAHLIS